MSAVSSTYPPKVASLTGDPSLAALCAGTIEPPSVLCQVVPDGMGFPPALIPLYAEGDVVVGIWKTWFTVRRASFVEYDLEAGQVIEVARSVPQFQTYVLVHAAYYGEGRVRTLARELGYAGAADDLLALPRRFAHPQDARRSRPEFATERPLDLVGSEETYDGDFPTSIDDTSKLAVSTPMELDGLEAGTHAVPPWVRTGADCPDLFERFLERRDLGSAWLALNSGTWAFPRMRACIRRLANASGDADFGRLAEAWSAVAATMLGRFTGG